MKIFDCTLRDGGNVVGKGFDKAITLSVIRALISAGIEDIEYGHCAGINCTKNDKSNAAPLSDNEYLEIVKPYVNDANLGMFVGWENCNPQICKEVKDAGLKFLRVGINAGDSKDAINAVKYVKNAGLECKVAMMKAYVLKPVELANEALELEKAGADHLVIMDSAGYMFPNQVEEYVKALKEKVSCIVGFHGHNNLGLASGNAFSAILAGADSIDGGLLGMARSAGNISTELLIAILERLGKNHYKFDKLIQYLEHELITEMKKYSYGRFVDVEDIILGFSGCHSNFLCLYKEVAEENKVNLYDLIIAVSKIDRKKPSRELINQVAKGL